MADPLLDLVDRLTAGATPRVRAAFLAAVAGGRADFLKLLPTLGAADALAVTALWADFEEQLAVIYGVDASSPLLAAAVAAARGAVEGLGVAWSVVEAGAWRRAAEWVVERGALRVTLVSGETREAIRDAVDVAFRGPASLRRLSNALVELPTLGLNRPLQRAFRRDSEAIFGRAVEEGWSKPRLLAALERAFQRRLRQRGDLIAMTEARDAVNAGVDAGLAEAVEQGRLDESEMELEWVTRVVNACPVCIALDGTRRRLSGGSFKSRPIPYGPRKGAIVYVIRPSAHPRCYCGTRTVRKGSPVRVRVR